MSGEVSPTKNPATGGPRAGSQPAKVTAKKRKARAKKPTHDKLTRFQLVGLILAVVGFIFPFLVDLPGLDPVGQRMFSIFLAAIVLWITEAVPLVATAVLVIFAEVVLISDKALLAVPEDAPAYQDFFSALASPVVMLFLGGFLIADGAAKFGVDRSLAALFIKPFKGSPRTTVLAIMAVTALMSMFMSNTATTATMFAVMLPVLSSVPPGKSRTGIALSIPVAANIGGIGTPVGTPPNAIAMGALAQRGVDLTFLQWFLAAAPFMLVMLVIAWAILAFFFIDGSQHIDVDFEAKFTRSRDAFVFYAVAAGTIILWMTEFLHGISSYVIGFFPVAFLLAFRIMGGNDLKRLDWPVLWLVGGGIALGAGVGKTGMDKWLIGQISWDNLPGIALFATLGLIAWGLSNVISNSATANLLVPLGLSLATGSLSGDAAEFAVILAISCSLAMCLPISTPPNAIAYSTGEVTTKAMSINGAVVGLIGIALLVLVAPFYWMMFNFIGI